MEILSQFKGEDRDGEHHEGENPFMDLIHLVGERFGTAPTDDQVPEIIEYFLELVSEHLSDEELNGAREKLAGVTTV